MKPGLNFIHRRCAAIRGSYPQVVHRTDCGASSFARSMVDGSGVPGLSFRPMPDDSVTHTDSDPDELLRPGDAARLLGCSTHTLANWSDSGKLRAIRLLGGDRRYRRADIIALATPTIVA